ncbi:MAG: sensor domain-containing diguanylate cyclase [Candidatus Thiodiazotropha sp.]
MMLRIAFVLGVMLFGLSIEAPASSAESKPLIVSQDAAWPPFSYLDDRDQPRGLLIDLWRTYGEVTGRSVEFQLVDWQESIDRVRSGEADVHGGLFQSDERDAYLDFSKQLFPLTTRLFVSPVLVADGLRSLGAVPVGIVRGGYEEEFVTINYPGVQLREFSNNREMVQAAVDGEILAFVADYPVGMYYLNVFRVPERFRVTQTLYTKYLRAAVKEGNGAMLQQVRNGLQRIPDSELERIRQKWILSVSVEVIPRWLVYTLVIGSALALVVALFAYTQILRRQVRRRTQELERANERLEVLAEQDQLTGLHNRFRLDRIFAHEIKRSMRYGHGFSVIMLDIDHFKRVNDAFGHQAGDQVLVSVAAMIRSHLRTTDQAGRWGGEEFMVVCPETDAAAAFQVAEKLRMAIGTDTHPRVGHLSISLGVADYREGDTLDSLTRRADEALYRAKGNGRNRTELASETTDNTPEGPTTSSSVVKLVFRNGRQPDPPSRS